MKPTDICTKCGHTREEHAERGDKCLYVNDARTLECHCYRPTFVRAEVFG